jgi:Ca2+-binding EF-hand superfamily protein
MSVSEQIEKQFREYIALQAYDDKYIDRQEEKKILEVGVKNNISVEESLALIQKVALEKGLVLERDAEERAKEFLAQAAANDGKVDKKEFEDAVALFGKATKGKIREPEMKKRLKQMMEDNGWKAKEGGLFGSKWYSAIS